MSFNTASPGGDLSDLSPLDDMAGEARVVALGEATHGTREFFQMKHRVLEFLVEEMDFNLFAIEATWPEANRLNEYVHTGIGDPVELLSGLYFWTWNTQEVLDMILWMRNHNQNPGDNPTVSFLGFDMQFPGMAIHNVLVFLDNVDPDAVAAMEDLYSYMLPFAKALRSARILVQYEDMASSRTLGARDLYMAENASRLLEQGGRDAKIVLWAHNGHVAYNLDYGGASSMGARLRQQYGEI